MALVAVAMTCDDGLRCTSSSLGCNSFGYTTIGTDSRWLGPKFSIMYRYKLINLIPDTTFCIVGVTDSGGARRRFWLEVSKSGSSIFAYGRYDTTACGTGSTGAITLQLTADTSEHSVAWTYNTAGNSVVYFDGVVKDTALASDLCTDFSSPASAGDRFSVMGNAFFDGTEQTNIDRVFYTNDVMTATQILNAHNDCSSF